MTTKLCTDLGQSRKLGEFLPIETADMHYLSGVARLGKPYSETHIPCWNLVSLLNILPSSTLDSSDDHHYRVHCKEMFTDWYDNPIDCCVDMIDRLHKQMIYDFNNS